MKEKFIEAYIWIFGSTIKSATEVYKKAEKNYIQEIFVQCKNQFRKSFYND